MNEDNINFSAPLVSTTWLNAHLEADNVRIIDGTYFLPNTRRNAAIEYEAEHIPGACFFDIDDIRDSLSISLLKLLIKKKERVEILKQKKNLVLALEMQ